MSEKIPNRTETKRAIARRLNISKWVTRAMFATAAGGGLLLAPTLAADYDAGPIQVLAGAVGLAGAPAAAVGERFHARKSANHMASVFMGAHRSRLLSPQVDFRLEEGTATERFTRIVSAESPLMAGLSVFAAGSEFISGGDTNTPDTALYLVGVGLAGMAIGGLAADHLHTKNTISAYGAALDNAAGPYS